MSFNWNSDFLTFDKTKWEAGWKAHKADAKKNPKPNFIDCVKVNIERIRWSARSANRADNATYWLWSSGAWRQVGSLVALVQGWCRHQLDSTKEGMECRNNWSKYGDYILKNIIGHNDCMFQDFDDEKWMDEETMPVFTTEAVFLVKRDGEIKKTAVDQKHNNLWSIPHPVIFDMPTPNFDKMLKDYGFDAGMQKTIRQLIGYCLSPLNTYPQFAFLTGTGKNGKSTLLNLIRRIIGSRNAQSIPLESLNDQTIEKLAGALANLPSENTKGTINEELLKVMAGGEKRISNPKYRDPYEIGLRAKNIFAFNSLPIIRDVSEAFWRRCIIIRFRKTIKIADPYFLRTINAEIPAILGRCIKELGEMNQRDGKIYISDTIALDTQEFKRDSSSSLQWLQETLDELVYNIHILKQKEPLNLTYGEIPSVFVKRRRDGSFEGTVRINLLLAYKRFNDWAKAQGYKVLGRKEWMNRLLQQVESTQRWRAFEYHKEKCLETLICNDDYDRANKKAMGGFEEETKPEPETTKNTPEHSEPNVTNEVEQIRSLLGAELILDDELPPKS